MCPDVNEKKKILIIDDSLTQLMFFRIHLRNAGYDVTIAQSAEEGFLKIVEVAPDLVLSDVIMNNISGFQLCSAVKSNMILKRIPFVLFTSAVDDTSNGFLAEKANADRFISKNLPVNVIIDVISHLINENEIIPAIKDVIRNSFSNPVQLFKELVNCHDGDWMQKLVENEFRSYTRYFDSTMVLVQKLFKMFSSIIDYNLAFLVFGAKDSVDRFELYSNANGKNVSGQTLNSMANDFMNQINQEVKYVLFPLKTKIFEEQEILSCAEYKKSLIIPFYKDGVFLGAIGFYSTSDEFENIVTFFDDVIEELNILMQEKLYSNSVSLLSYKDNEIGLYNKYYFSENLERELERCKRNHSSLSLMMLKFNNYLELNEVFGCDVVNLLVKKSLSSITNSLRFPDKIYRYSPDTMLMLLANVSSLSANNVAQRIKKQIDEIEISLDNEKYKLNSSFVITDAKEGNANPEAMLDCLKSNINQVRDVTSEGILIK